MLLILTTLLVTSNALFTQHVQEGVDEPFGRDCKPGAYTRQARYLVDLAYTKNPKLDHEREVVCAREAFKKGTSYIYSRAEQDGVQECHLFAFQIDANWKAPSEAQYMRDTEHWTTCRVTAAGREHDLIGEECWTDGGCRGDGSACAYCGTHGGKKMICCRKGWSGDHASCRGVTFSPHTIGHQCVVPLKDVAEMTFANGPASNVNTLIYLFAGLGFGVVAYGAVKHYTKY